MGSELAQKLVQEVFCYYFMAADGTTTTLNATTKKTSKSFRFIFVGVSVHLQKAVASMPLHKDGGSMENIAFVALRNRNGTRTSVEKYIKCRFRAIFRLTHSTATQLSLPFSLPWVFRAIVQEMAEKKYNAYRKEFELQNSFWHSTRNWCQFSIPIQLCSHCDSFKWKNGKFYYCIECAAISREDSTELKRYIWCGRNTYGSGVWYGELTWRTYCVLWKIRNASDAKKSRAVKRPAAGRSVNPVLLRKKLLISSNCGMRVSQKMPSFWSLAKTLRYSRQACFGIKSRTVRNTEPQVWFSTSLYSICGIGSPLWNEEYGNWVNKQSHTKN